MVQMRGGIGEKAAASLPSELQAPVVAWAADTYDRVADHAWTVAMEVLDDAESAARVLVDAFCEHACADGRCQDLAVLTTVVRLARGRTVPVRSAT